MEQLLSCSVCLERFQEPKQLPCGHTFCVSCLDGVVRNCRLRCPECRAQHEVPRIGVQGFPNNWAIRRLLELPHGEISCQGCSKKNCMIGKCVHCQLMLCRECLLKHSSIMKKELEQSVSQVKDRIPEVSKYILAIGKRQQKIEENEKTVISLIEQWVDRCVAQLQAKKKSLIEKAKKFAKEEIRTLQGNQEALETEIAIMESFCEMQEKQRSRSSSTVEISEEQSSLLDLIQQSGEHINKKIGGDMKEKTAKFDLEKANTLLDSISKFQGVFTQISGGHKTTTLTPTAPDPTTLSNTRSHTDQVTTRGTDFNAPGSGDSTILQHYRKIGQVKTWFGSKGDDAGCLSLPWGLASTSNDNIVVAEHGNNRIQIFDAIGNSLEVIGHQGNGDEEFYAPCGVCVTPSGHMVVADTRNNRIQVFDSQGNFMRKFGMQGQGKLSSPWSVADNGDGVLYVSDDSNSIKVFSLHGIFINSFGGSWLKSLGGEKYVAVTKDKKLVVSETKNHRIGVFDENGWLLWEKGPEEGYFMFPRGVACDHQGNIIVSDCGSSSVQIFDPSLNYITSFGNVGSTPGCMERPSGVTVMKNGDIAITDSNNNRIQIF